MTTINKLNMIANLLRAKAESMKERKQKIAIALFEKVGAGHNHAQHFISLQQNLMATTQSILTVGETIAKNQTLRRMTSELVGNTVQDVANRINQLASLIEAAAKEEDIKNGFDSIEEAMESFKEKLAAADKKLRPKKNRKFRVVN